MNRTLTIRLDDAAAAALEEEARRKSTSKGAIVRKLIEEHARRGHGNALEALADIVGVVSGASDLSTNPKHREGFGRSRRKRK